MGMVSMGAVDPGVPSRRLPVLRSSRRCDGSATYRHLIGTESEFLCIGELDSVADPADAPPEVPSGRAYAVRARLGPAREWSMGARFGLLSPGSAALGEQVQVNGIGHRLVARVVGVQVIAAVIGRQ